MLTPRQKYEVCRVKSGVAYLSYFDTLIIDKIGFSTRRGRIEIDWGDGSVVTVDPTKYYDYAATTEGLNIANHIYSSTFEGDLKLKFLMGLNDVYSLSVSPPPDSLNNNNKIKILDFGVFISQFPNLFSFLLNTYSGAVTARKPIIKGNLFDLPSSVRRIWIGSTQINILGAELYANIDTLKEKDSNLTYFYKHPNGDNVIKLFGDLSNLPIPCNYFKWELVHSSSAITYTAGKVWASSFDTLSIPLALSTTELDNLLIDMNNSITTKIGDGVITLGGWRSPASDPYVASLQTKGFSVNIQRTELRKEIILDSSVLMRMDFQNNYDVYSNSLIDITSGNGVGATGNLPSFTLSGRKAGEYCAVFNGSQSIKTTTNLPINSDKVTVAFWMKTTQTGHAKITDLNTWNGGNRFTIGINDGAKIRAISGPSANVCDNQSTINDGVWKHIVFTFDRSKVANQEIKMYINGVVATTTNSISNNGTGNFENTILTIGASGSSLYFNGSLTKLKLYNYPLTPGEVSTLYNSEL